MKKSNKYLVVLFLSFIVFGFIEGLYPAGGDNARAMGVIHTFIIAVLIFAWCDNHALENNVESTGGYRLLAAVFPPLGIPIYFFKCFGFKRGGFKVLISMGALVILVAGFGISYSIIQG